MHDAEGGLGRVRFQNWGSSQGWGLKVTSVFSWRRTSYRHSALKRQNPAVNKETSRCVPPLTPCRFLLRTSRPPGVWGELWGSEGFVWAATPARWRTRWRPSSPTERLCQSEPAVRFLWTSWTLRLCWDKHKRVEGYGPLWNKITVIETEPTGQ